MRTAAIVYLIVVAIMSLWAFVTYGIDKRRAQTGRRRVPENSLHLLALAGGWPGALAGQRVFRHKTQKLGFRLVFWMVVVLHLGLVGSVAYLL
ncbi:MAG: DUF1294 domain-containing protein [Rhodopirellula sp.]|nr:DUF1294 domain-containing protein [Rhodopirellula sp.]